MRDVERVPRGSNGWRGPPTLESMPDSTDTRERSSVLGGLSWFQVLAGALAAMTSAWIASALGVAGTIVGAALGSLVVTITSSLYASTLDKGRTLIVQTDGGQVVETEAEPGHTAEALAAVRRATHEEVTGAEVVDAPRRTIRWRAVALSTVVVLLVAGLAMGSYELVTGKAYGSNPDNPRIGHFSGGGGSGQRDDQPTPTESATPDPTTSPTPDDEATPDPTPTPTPTSSADPVPTPPPSATTGEQQDPAPAP